MKPPALILAGDYAHARLVARAVGLLQCEWRFVAESWQMHGYRDPVVYVYDTFESHRYFVEIVDALQVVGDKNVVIITEEFL